MAYFNTCPQCGCNLDPGEICDCRKEKAGATQEAQGQQDESGTEESQSQVAL